MKNFISKYIYLEDGFLTWGNVIIMTMVLWACVAMIFGTDWLG